MRAMYCNLTRSQAFPLAVRISFHSTCVRHFHTPKSQSLAVGFCPKPLLNPIHENHNDISSGFGHKTCRVLNFVTPTRYSAGFHQKCIQIGSIAKPRRVSNGCSSRTDVNCCPLISARRSYSSSYLQRAGHRSSVVVRSGKTLPWLASNRGKEVKRLEKGTNTKTSSSWEEAAKSFEKASYSSSWEEAAEKLEEVPIARTDSSSWQEASKTLSGRKSANGQGESRNRIAGIFKKRQIAGRVERDRSELLAEEEEEVVDEGEEVIDDPRWDKIKKRFHVKTGPERPEFRKWSKQEAWGRKTWKDATESSVPKMVGEEVYGVGPVLAALSVGRREFYALYVQEGLDLSGNNRKKKDKKGIEKVLRVAEKIGLSIKETSKHDLNMIVDNRPHQGLVLDASPLEMVKIKELDPISSEGEKGSLWVALDEVTDPQNMGAIVRSAYFFGASGIVLCAKNSAPLSGVVSKASAGSLELMELRYCKNMMQFLVSSAENGWRVLGASVSSRAVPLNEVSLGSPTILVLGSEGTGLRPLVERSCSQLIKIPGSIPMDVTVGGGDHAQSTDVNSGCSGMEFQSFLAVESLNVSVAAGVLLHHLIGNSHTNNSKISDKQTALLE